MAQATEIGAMSSQPATWFAPAERAPEEELRAVARMVNDSPLVTTLLEVFGGLVAVLNAQRQVLAVNSGLLRFLDVKDADALLGLRPGEALHCVHANDHPGGCGTSRFCSTCGAAIAIVLSQTSSTPAERECLLTIDGGNPHAVELLVRAAPLSLGTQRMIALILQDIRGEKRRQALERVFFHDLTNTLQGMLGYSDLLKVASPDRHPHLARQISTLADCLAEEVRSQQLLIQADAGCYEVSRVPVFASQVMEEVEAAVKGQAVTRGKELRVLVPERDVRLRTDPALLHRSLVNMVKNALEATPAGGVVEHWCEADATAVTWKVWNPGAMSEAVALRVFQRHFTTKNETGRGLGTYSMKLFGEHYLGGSVWFTTSASEGTVFCLRLPLLVEDTRGPVW